jgi:hypothetical protein
VLDKQFIVENQRWVTARSPAPYSGSRHELGLRFVHATNLSAASGAELECVVERRRLVREFVCGNADLGGERGATRLKEYFRKVASDLDTRRLLRWSSIRICRLHAEAVRRLVDRRLPGSADLASPGPDHDGFGSPAPPQPWVAPMSLINTSCRSETLDAIRAAA